MMTDVWIISIDGSSYNFLIQRRGEKGVTLAESWALTEAPLSKARDLARALGYTGPLPACAGNVYFSLTGTKAPAIITRHTGGIYETRYIHMDGSPAPSPFDR